MRKVYTMSFSEINFLRAIKYSICGLFSNVLNTIYSDLRENITVFRTKCILFRSLPLQRITVSAYSGGKLRSLSSVYMYSLVGQSIANSRLGSCSKATFEVKLRIFVFCENIIEELVVKL